MKDPRQSPDLGSIGPVTDGESSSSIFNLLRGRKFLAAVVTGSSIGKLQLQLYKSQNNFFRSPTGRLRHVFGTLARSKRREYSSIRISKGQIGEQFSVKIGFLSHTNHYH